MESVPPTGSFRPDRWPDRDEAETIATALVDERLCACVNVVGPIRSIYRWQGKVERTDEFLCIAKTSAGNIAAVKARLPQLHSYEVPELLHFHRRWLW